MHFLLFLRLALEELRFGLTGERTLSETKIPKEASVVQNPIIGGGEYPEVGEER